MTPPPAFCTIVAKNYLAYARVLMESVRRHHPEAGAYVLLVDDPHGFFDPGQEPFTVLQLADVPLPRPRELCFRYELLELATAVKPFFMAELFARGHPRVIFLDPDIVLYRPLEPVLAALSESQVVLTPHLTAPLLDEGKPGERDILQAGTYNLGFLGLSRGAETDALLAWWQKRCERHSLVDPASGLFVDQRWMDLAPAFVESLRVLRHPGLNVAYWNLATRLLTGRPEAPLVNGAPLYFFHFSGLDPLRPGTLSKHQDRFPGVVGEPLSSLVNAYTAALLAAGYQSSAHWPYTHGTFSDGHPIGRELRDLFREAPEGRFPDPFQTEVPGSFLSHAITRDDGGLAPLARALAPAWRASSGRPREGPLASVRRKARRALGLSSLPFPPPPGDGLAPLARRIFERRPDVRAAYSTPSGGVDQVRFLHWLATDGVAQHQLKPAWCLQWMQRDSEVPGLVPRLLALYDAQPALRREFPLAFVAEHDAPRFLAHLIERSGELGLDGPSIVALRLLSASLPDRRIAEILQSRPDVRRAFPEALGWPGDPDFLAWLRESGRKEYGVTEDAVLWFERARAQHTCPRLRSLYASRSDWQARHPLAFSPLGRASFVAWLRESREAAPGFDVPLLGGLCVPGPSRPLDELRTLHETDAGLRLRFPRAFENGADTAALLEWLEQEAAPRLGLTTAWREGVRRELGARGLFGRGATVVGYLRTESGMGELARATARSLFAVGYPAATVSLEAAPQRQADFTVPEQGRAESMPFTIVHMNAPEAVRHQQRFAARRATSHLIGYWAWELEELPPSWDEAFSLFDEVWTCSRFAAQAIGAASPVPVQAVWPCVAEILPVPFDRAGVGIAPAEFTFLFLYDLLSETERKNPLGLIRAFRQAFRPDEAVRLVIKTSNAEMRRDDYRRVVDAAQGHRITVFDRYLGRPEALGLIEACDAYVSLHRSEGFGFTLAEAMWLGKPAIATHYSGNTDFMTPWNSFAVPFRLVEVGAGHGPYAAHALWAEPDLGAAAELLRACFMEKEQTAERARRGRADVQRLLSPRACGERIARRLGTIGEHRLVRSRSDAPPRAAGH
jgi:glycosyltransferase involved in cell wall biosynthesis